MILGIAKLNAFREVKMAYPPEIYNHLSEEEVIVSGLNEDQQFQEYVVSSYDDNSGNVSLGDGGTCIFVDPLSPIKPTSGLKIRLYGRGLGYTVRGITVETPQGLETVRYRTPIEAAEDHWDWCKKLEAQREAEYNEEVREIKIAALPPVFRERIQYFRQKDPRFIYDSEPYEVYVYEQATVFAAVLGSEKAIDEFKEKPFSEQCAIVLEKAGPELAEEFKEHSGNTFECACAFAKKLLTDMESLSPLKN